MKTATETETLLLKILRAMVHKQQQGEPQSDVVTGIAIGLLWTFPDDIYPPEAAVLKVQMKAMLDAIDDYYARLIASKQ